MRRYLNRPVRRSAVAAAMILVAVTGCSSTDSGDQAADTSAPTSPSSTAFSEPPPLPEEPTPPGSVGVSPGGVTTKVDVPADATESQYGQACRAAKLWMTDKPGDPPALAEAYLKELQAPGVVGPGTFDTPWAQLTPAQQAAVVLAVNGAANDECG